MATGWEMVPETAKALSAPITKLVEVIASGCGRMYGPTDIRRTAAAQGDAMVLLEEAKSRVSEVSMRAARRVLDVEERRQINIEAIAQIAQNELPPEVSDLPVEVDWITRFFSEAQEVSNEQVRVLWGKILAGEVAKPGSFSRRTLAVVSNLSQGDAEKFGRLCSLTSKVHGNPLSTFLLTTREGGKLGFTFSDMIELESAGLITVQAAGTTLTFTREAVDDQILMVVEFANDVALRATFKGEDSVTVNTGVVAFTPAGAELFTICNWKPVDGREKLVFDRLIEEGWDVTRVRIAERTPEGFVKLAFPLPF